MTDAQKKDNGLHSSGVQSLINRLHDDGVNLGKAEGEKIVAEAESRSEWIIQQANEEAQRIIENATKEASFIKDSGSDALEMAYRDILISLKNNLLDQFSGRIHSVVSTALEDENLLVSMILEIAKNDRNSDSPIKLLLPKKFIGLEDLRKNPDQLKDSPLLSFIAEQASAMLENGVEIGVGEHREAGIVVRRNAGEIELELTEQALSRLLLKHLQPRFRALIEGIVG